MYLRLKLATTAHLLAAALGIAVLTAPAGPRAEAAAQPILVKVHADWCQTCTRLEPTWRRIEAEYGDRVRMVVFDVTDRGSLESSRENARRLGLSELFDDVKSSTGTIAVLRPNREPVRIFKGVLDYAVYEAAIREADAS